MHVGALLGTIMAGNVFFVIIPAQKALKYKYMYVKLYQLKALDIYLSKIVILLLV